MHLLKYTGLVLRDAVSESDTSMFAYVVPANVAKSFTVAVTPFSFGDPTLYIMAGSGDEIHVAETAGADYIVIDHAATPQAKTYQIFVYANGSSTFTVVASPATTAAPTVLLGGYAQDDFVKEGQYRHYVLEVPAGNEDVIISVTPLTGNPNLYVNPQSAGFYDGTTDAVWSSAKAHGSDLLLISSSSPNFISTGGKYYVTVFSVGDSEFTVTGFSANTVVTIRYVDQMVVVL